MQGVAGWEPGTGRATSYSSVDSLPAVLDVAPGKGEVVRDSLVQVSSAVFQTDRLTRDSPDLRTDDVAAPRRKSATMPPSYPLGDVTGLLNVMVRPRLNKDLNHCLSSLPRSVQQLAWLFHFSHRPV